jgi:hypothetical protein
LASILRYAHFFLSVVHSSTCPEISSGSVP